MLRLKTKNFKLKTIQGQSLAELLIALAIGGFLVTSAAIAIMMVMKNDSQAKDVQTATFLSQNEIDTVRSMSESNWLTLYNLTKGTSTQYLVIPSATSTASTTVVSGKESVLADDVTYGLVGYWKFDEGAGTKAYDFSGNGNNGTSASFPAWTASSSCESGSCLSFNGTNNYLTIPDSSIIKPTNAISLSAWVYPTSSSVAQIILESGPNGNSSGWFLAFCGGNFYLRLYTSGSGIYKMTSNSFSLNAWHHVFATYDSANFHLYVDNVEQTTFTTGGVCSATNTFTSGSISYGNPSSLFIGTRNATSAYFSGLIDDVRVYNRALSASEISQLYNSSIFNRYFSVENVNRDSCGVGNITAGSVTSCLSGPQTSGVAEDPSTQKITVHIEWTGGVNLSRAEYISRSVNKIFNENNWSGGSGQFGVITAPDGRYASSTGVATSTGSIRIQGL